jgi:hypothetical protein
VESSGWPKNVNTPEERQHFIQEYQAKDIWIDPEAIEFNSGKRFMSKNLNNKLTSHFFFIANV